MATRTQKIKLPSTQGTAHALEVVQSSGTVVFAVDGNGKLYISAVDLGNGDITNAGNISATGLTTLVKPSTATATLLALKHQTSSTWASVYATIDNNGWGEINVGNTGGRYMSLNGYSGVWISPYIFNQGAGLALGTSSTSGYGLYVANPTSGNGSAYFAGAVACNANLILNNSNLYFHTVDSNHRLYYDSTVDGPIVRGYAGVKLMVYDSGALTGATVTSTGLTVDKAVSVGSNLTVNGNLITPTTSQTQSVLMQTSDLFGDFVQARGMGNTTSGLTITMPAGKFAVIRGKRVVTTAATFTCTANDSGGIYLDTSGVYHLTTGWGTWGSNSGAKTAEPSDSRYVLTWQTNATAVTSTGTYFLSVDLGFTYAGGVISGSNGTYNFNDGYGYQRITSYNGLWVQTTNNNNTSTLSGYGLSTNKVNLGYSYGAYGSGALNFNTSTSTSGGIYFSTDTYLYRSGPSYLNTNATLDVGGNLYTHGSITALTGLAIYGGLSFGYGYQTISFPDQISFYDSDYGITILAMGGDVGFVLSRDLTMDSQSIYTNGGSIHAGGGDILVAYDALDVSATSGFLHISCCAGTPTGVPPYPSTYTGVVPLVYDTTNNKLYAYNSGWNSVTATGGSGTVTSVALTAPSFLSVSGSPITTSGTLALSLATQNANIVFAGPTTGTAAAPTFRSLVANDIPSTLNATTFAGSTPITFTTANAKITSSTGLVLEETGDSFGTVRLYLQNRIGVNGAMFEQAGSVDLMDFVFKGLSNQRNIRYENRSGSQFHATPEFQLGLPNDPTVVISDTGFFHRKTAFGVFGATPVSQRTSTSDLRQGLIDLGFFASGGATPLNLNGGAFVAGTVSIATTSGSGVLNLAAATVASGGIYFGSDVTLYRSAADVLKTDDSLIVGGRVTLNTSTNSGTTQTISVAGCNNINFTATANTTLTLSNGVDQQLLRLRFIQGGSAGYTLTITSANFGSGVTDLTAATQSTVGKYAYVGLIYNGSSSKWDVVSCSGGFS